MIPQRQDRVHPGCWLVIATAIGALAVAFYRDEQIGGWKGVLGLACAVSTPIVLLLAIGWRLKRFEEGHRTWATRIFDVVVVVALIAGAIAATREDPFWFLKGGGARYRQAMGY